MCFYVVINSDQNMDYFPDNRPFAFKTYFSKPLNLEGKWKVALSEIDVNEKMQKPSIYVYSNLCQSVVFDGIITNVLRKINTDVRRQFANSFNWLYYLPVIKNEIREIEISIKDANGNFASFLSKPITVTLHFVKD